MSNKITLDTLPPAEWVEMWEQVYETAIKHEQLLFAEGHLEANLHSLLFMVHPEKKITLAEALYTEGYTRYVAEEDPDLPLNIFRAEQMSDDERQQYGLKKTSNTFVIKHDTIHKDGVL